MKLVYGSIISAVIILSLTSGLNAQSLDSIPIPVSDFYNEGAASNSAINARAPKETQGFGQLAGIWYCTESSVDPETGESTVRSHAYWAWKYILDGYGVQDFWYQGKNESAYWDYFKREIMLTQIRVFDVKEKVWKIAFINNNAGEAPGRVFGLFTANEVENDMVMEFNPQEPSNHRRIIFFNIGEDSFDWRFERSTDEGKNWVVVSQISAKRIK